MYWIERLELEDEWDPDSEQIWVLYSITSCKELAFRYMQMEGYRVTKKGAVKPLIFFTLCNERFCSHKMEVAYGRL